MYFVSVSRGSTVVAHYIFNGVRNFGQKLWRKKETSIFRPINFRKFAVSGLIKLNLNLFFSRITSTLWIEYNTISFTQQESIYKKFYYNSTRNYFFIFYSLCISIRTCNKNQPETLFILSLFLQLTSTCFWHICSPSSGGVLYTYNTCQLLYIYSIPPDDELQICPKHVEVDLRNKLRISSASRWFYLHVRNYFCPYIILNSDGKIC